jgi:hypothetical protein
LVAKRKSKFVQLEPQKLGGRFGSGCTLARAREHEDRGGDVIPANFIAEWRAQTRWPTDEQVEQDLVLSRALAAISTALRSGSQLAPLDITRHRLHRRRWVR